MQTTQRLILFLVAQAGRLPLKDAVHIGGLLNKSDSSVRACVNRLAGTGLLVREKSPPKAAVYSISDRGRTLASEILRRFIRIHEIIEAEHSWDGTWTLVSFDIPERLRKKRDELRIGLREMGFGLLTGGLWVAPGDASEEVAALADSLRIGKKIVVSLSKDVRLGGRPIAELASKIWSLAELNREYSSMQKRMRSRIEKMRKRIREGPAPDAREAFLEIFILFGEAVELISKDPCLPEDLLPRDWLGLEVQDMIHEYFHMLHGLELDDPYSFLLELPDQLHIPTPRGN